MGIIRCYKTTVYYIYPNIRPVNRTPTAACKTTVELVADDIVRTTEMVDGVVQLSVAATRVAGHQGLNTVAADVFSSVVDHALAAARVRAVLTRPHAISTIRNRKPDSRSCAHASIERKCTFKISKKHAF